MDRRSLAGTIPPVLLASGVAAVIGAEALPPHHPYFTVMLIVGTVGIIASILGYLWLFLTKPGPASDARTSTTIKARGGGRVDLEDFVSGADTFADVDEFSSMSAKRGIHAPGAVAGAAPRKGNDDV